MAEEMKTTTEEIEETIKAKKKPVTRAKRKVWISLGILTIVFAALSVLISMFLHPVFGLAFGGICEIVALIVWLPSELKRVKRCFCPECGEKYNYNNDVEWEVSDVEIKEKSTNPNSDKKQVAGVRIEHIEAECTCSKCGANSCFSHKFRTGVVYDNGQVKVQNIQTIVKKYFKV